MNIYNFVNDDITFCMNDCYIEECKRHPSNIRNKEYPHSYSFLKGTEFCSYYDENYNWIKKEND